jgi:hypothetical protein
MIHRTIIKKNDKDYTSGGEKIVHLQFNSGENHYFGSIAAIFDTFTPERLGVSKSRLWAFGIAPDKPYRNKHCTIRKGFIKRKKGGRGGAL